MAVFFGRHLGIFDMFVSGVFPAITPDPIQSLVELGTAEQLREITQLPNNSFATGNRVHLYSTDGG